MSWPFFIGLSKSLSRTYCVFGTMRCWREGCDTVHTFKKLGEDGPWARLSMVDDNEMPGSKPTEKELSGRREVPDQPTELRVFQGNQLAEVFGVGLWRNLVKGSPEMWFGPSCVVIF